MAWLLLILGGLFAFRNDGRFTFVRINYTVDF